MYCLGREGCKPIACSHVVDEFRREDLNHGGAILKLKAWFVVWSGDELHRTQVDTKDTRDGHNNCPATRAYYLIVKYGESIMRTGNCIGDGGSHSVNNNHGRTGDIQLSKSLSWVLRHAAPSFGLQLTPDGYVPLAEILALHHPRFRTKDNRPKYTVEDVIRVVENNDKQRFRLDFRDMGDRGGEIATAAITSGDDTLRFENGQAKNTACLNSTRNCDNNDSNLNSKMNYIFEGKSSDKRSLCIRANQGHSLKGLQADQLLTSLTREQLSNPTLSIIHGTTQKAWEEHIQNEGLSRRKRNHIHFATGLPTFSQPTASKNASDKTRSEEYKHVPPISGIRSTSEIYIFINGDKCASDGILFYRSDNGVILTAGVNDKGILPTKYFEKVVHATSGTIIWKKEE